jgi:hypothetical protein
MDIPLKRNFYTKHQIKKMFKNIMDYDYESRIVKQQYKLENISIEPTFKGKYFLILSKKSDYLEMNLLSDMFQEKARLKCKVHNSKYSPYDFYNKFKSIIYAKCKKEYGRTKDHNIRETLYNACKECSIFRPALMVTIIKLFNSKTILDFSSGWGDRLIGAMACDKYIDFYCGVDPNPDLVDGYANMISFFKKDPQKFKMIQYDLVFTSPPFFDIEIYRIDDFQSSRHSTERDWFDDFLKICINKSVDLLCMNGILALSINRKKTSFVYILDARIY